VLVLDQCSDSGRCSTGTGCDECELLQDISKKERRPLTRQVLNPDNPFILVHSPIVSNYDLSKMVEAHKARREVDKNVIMTMGVARGGRWVKNPQC